METQDLKCAIVLDEALPIGVAANVSAIMGITLGRMLPGIVGADVMDAEGGVHPGIVEIPVPVLKATAPAIGEIRQGALALEPSELEIVDFSDVAQGCKEYGEYIEKMAVTGSSSITYLGLLLVGRKKLVNKLVGSLPLMR